MSNHQPQKTNSKQTWKRLVAGYRLLAAGCSLLAAGYRLLAADCWLSTVGCYLLSVPCWLLAVSCWLFPVPCKAQPVGHFLTDTIELGRPFQYALTVRHPVTQDVFFPDTARQFAPFLVQSVALFPTKTQADVSTDSAVYTLVSFEVSRARVLQVPVYLASKQDCTAVLSLPDTVFLRSSLPPTNQPDTLALATRTEPVPLPQQFNYPYLALVATGLGVLMGAIYILFGKALRRRWQRFQLARQHTQFLTAYNRLTRNLGPESTQETSNAAIVIWKEYLEQVENQPYTSLTSREIADRIQDYRLADALREMDRIVYGGSFTDQSPLALRTLRDVAVSAYERRTSAL